MSEAPSVSVVIPTHQRRDLVRQAVRSVLAQTYRDFELIVVDDGSSDGTREALDGLDPRIRYRWQPNRGAGAARNAGLRLARGSIVAFLDSDNLWTPEHLETLTRALEGHPEADIAYTGLGRAGGETRVKAPIADLLHGNIVPFTSGVALRREVALGADGFDERLAVGEDADLWMRLALRGSRFAIPPQRTVIRRAIRNSLTSERGTGDYAEAAEIGARRAIAELEGARGEEAARRLALARGRYALIEAVRALGTDDGDELRRKLREACRLLPELAEHPRSVASHIRYDLPSSAKRSEVAARLAGVARAWPLPRSDPSRVLAAEALVEAGLSGRPREIARTARAAPTGPALPFIVGELRAAARARIREELRARMDRARGLRARPQRLDLTAQRLLVRIANGLLAGVSRRGYEALARVAASYLVAGTGAAAYLKGSVGRGEPLYGVSDIDLAIVLPGGVGDEAIERRINDRWRRLRGRLPTLCRALFERPRIYRREELSASTLLHGLSADRDHWRPRPSSRERRRERGGSERPGLYGPAPDWRRIRGRETAVPPRAWADAGELWPAAWLELQFWWLQAFKACASPDALWKRYLCAKLVLEPARVWLWVAHGERPESWQELARRASARLPEEAPALRGALALRDSISRSVRVPLGASLAALARISDRVAAELTAPVQSSAATQVRLRWGGAGEIVTDADTDAAGTGAALGCGPASPPLPLVDWRARVWSGPPDEALSPIPGDLDPALLGAAAHEGDAGAYPALRCGGLLLLPSLKRARLRAVQCAATDPVSFALLDGSDWAEFPDIPGWSVQDSARRAVAEHLGALERLEAGGDPDGEALGRLFTAARAANLLEGIHSGQPELDLTVAAIAARLRGSPSVGSGLADQALAELRRSRIHREPPDAALVDALRRGVAALPAFKLGLERR
ncbi:MAG: glycosyltransferase [Solirubrobacterales bacterium]